MAQNVLTDKGFNRPTLAVLVQRIGDRLEAALGPINRNPDSNTGQLIGSIAEELSIAYETSEAVWLSRFLGSASGFALDAVGEWMGGTQRRDRSQTQVNTVLYGDEGTTVPAGSLSSYQNENFTLVESVTITRGSLVKGQFSVGTPVRSSYTFRVNSIDFFYDTPGGATAAQVAAGIAEVINDTGIFSATATGTTVSLTSVNQIEGYSASLSDGLTWVRIGSPGVFRAVEYGPIIVPIGALNNPVSAISGWTGIENLVVGSTGNERESDTDYRNRLKSDLGGTRGRATVDSIRAALLNDVEGVTLAEVIENDRIAVVDGMEPKSILCIVDGGLEQEIAQKIWDYKGAGIELMGDIGVTAYDSAGRSHLVRFSRSTPTEVYIRVEVTKLDTEEALPPDIIPRIQAGVENYFATLGLGNDVIIDRIPGYIFSMTSGIAKMTVTASIDGVDFNDDDIPIPATGYASLIETEVTGV